MSASGTQANLSGASHGPATHTGAGNPTMANANTNNASATTGSTGGAGKDLATDAQAPFKAVNVSVPFTPLPFLVLDLVRIWMNWFADDGRVMQDVGESIRTNINSFADNLLGGKKGGS